MQHYNDVGDYLDMSIAIGIFDFFAYTIPGTLYLYLINETLRLLKLTYVDITRLDNFVHIILIAISAYLVGHLMESISFLFCYRLMYPLMYRSKSGWIGDVVLAEMKEQYPELGIQFESNQYDLLYGILRHKNLDMSRSIDKFEADSVMLQSVSFALFLFAVYRMVSYALSRSVFDVLLAIAAIIFCVISFRRSVKFRRMFYSAIYQEVLVYGNSLRDIIEREIPRRETNRQARSKPERAKSIASSTAIPTYQETDSAQPTLGR